MKIIKPGHEILTALNGIEILRHIERVGRVCYKSEDRITDESCVEFVKSLIKRGHEAMIEHFSFSVRFICDRGVSHELVRHRLASFAQESTRYCNYGKSGEVTFIEPSFWLGPHSPFSSRTKCREEWEDSCRLAEKTYLDMIEFGKATPQEARSVLPNSLKTEVVMTANLREWRHFLRLRTASTAHPQMQELIRPLLDKLKTLIPVVFDDICY